MVHWLRWAAGCWPWGPQIFQLLNIFLRRAMCPQRYALVPRVASVIIVGALFLKKSKYSHKSRAWHCWSRHAAILVTVVSDFWAMQLNVNNVCICSSLYSTGSVFMQRFRLLLGQWGDNLGVQTVIIIKWHFFEIFLPSLTKSLTV